MHSGNSLCMCLYFLWYSGIANLNLCVWPGQCSLGGKTFLCSLHLYLPSQSTVILTISRYKFKIQLLVFTNNQLESIRTQINVKFIIDEFFLNPQFCKAKDTRCCPTSSTRAYPQEQWAQPVQVTWRERDRSPSWSGKCTKPLLQGLLIQPQLLHLWLCFHELFFPLS